MNVDILDGGGIASFEAACHTAGARVIGGLLACAALTDQELAGIERYGVNTPITARRSPKAFRTTGWCKRIVPIDVEVGEQPFSELAALAKEAFDERQDLARGPVERVLEIAGKLPEVRPAATGGITLSYMHVNLPPLVAHIARAWHQGRGRVYINQGMAAQVAL